jgi:hypothetical protein
MKPGHVELIRTKDGRGGEQYKAGDRFTVPAFQAKVLVAVGKARYASLAAEPAKGTYLRSDMTAVPRPTLSVPRRNKKVDMSDEG